MTAIEKFILESLRGLPYSKFQTGTPIESAFNSFIELDISEGIIEVPTIYINYAGVSYDTLVAPISTRVSYSSIEQRRQASSILNNFCHNKAITTSAGFVPVKTPAGDLYYGLPGIILNGNKEPLLIITAEIKKEKVDIPVESYTVVLNRLICHVSPKVFTNSTKILESAIIKKIIPFCAQKKITIYDLYKSVLSYEGSILGSTIKVIIDDCDFFVIKSCAPTSSCEHDKICNNIIKENIEEILHDTV